MLRLDLRPGEGFDIDNGRIVVRIEQKNGQASRITIDAARDIPIQVLGDKESVPLARHGLTRAK